MSLAYLGMDGRKTMGCLARISGFLHAGCNAGLWGRSQSTHLGEAAAAHQCVCRRHRQHIGVTGFPFCLSAAPSPPNAAACCRLLLWCTSISALHTNTLKHASSHACSACVIEAAETHSSVIGHKKHVLHCHSHEKSLHKAEMQWTDLTTVRGAEKSSKAVHFHFCRGREVQEQYPCRMLWM